MNLIRMPWNATLYKFNIIWAMRSRMCVCVCVQKIGRQVRCSSSNNKNTIMINGSKQFLLCDYFENFIYYLLESLGWWIPSTSARPPPPPPPPFRSTFLSHLYFIDFIHMHLLSLTLSIFLFLCLLSRGFFVFLYSFPSYPHPHRPFLLSAPSHFVVCRAIRPLCQLLVTF